ncbi:MAG: flagellar biosynthesis protein FlhF [Betaproteobacteria bacterium]
MNVNRFTARNSREALALVRQAFGHDAVVLSTRPCDEGVEVLAMASDGMQHIERLSATAPKAAPPQVEPERGASDVAADVARLSMSTLSFQDYVRERMLKRRRAALHADAAPAAEPPLVDERPPEPAVETAMPRVPRHEPPLLREEIGVAPPAVPAQPATPRREPNDQAMMDELRRMKGMIEERFGALAFIGRLQNQPGQARLAQKLLDAGFSPALARKLADGLPADVNDELGWAGAVLERNLATDEAEPALEDQGGVYALIGSTGVGKTTSTAKIAAAFAARHGAAQLGLITLDAYRVGAHEQLRAYGRILGVPVHTAHDRATLEDLLDLLGAKKMVLIDTAGIGQRDSRTRELLDMLARPSIRRLLVVNAAAQGETIEDVLLAYRASQCAGVVLSKLDEAIKLGPALDALVRHKLKVVGVANGQRVPEDWHRLSAQALVQRALRTPGASAWRIEAADVNLFFAGARPAAAHA